MIRSRWDDDDPPPTASTDPAPHTTGGTCNACQPDKETP